MNILSGVTIGGPVMPVGHWGTSPPPLPRAGTRTPLWLLVVFVFFLFISGGGTRTWHVFQYGRQRSDPRHCHSLCPQPLLLHTNLYGGARFPGAGGIVGQRKMPRHARKDGLQCDQGWWHSSRGLHVDVRVWKACLALNNYAKKKWIQE